MDKKTYINMENESKDGVIKTSEDSEICNSWMNSDRFWKRVFGAFFYYLTGYLLISLVIIVIAIVLAIIYVVFFRA